MKIKERCFTHLNGKRCKGEVEIASNSYKQFEEEYDSVAKCDVCGVSHIATVTNEDFFNVKNG